MLGQKRFLHSKSAKNVLCLFSGSIQNVAPMFLQCFVLAFQKRQSTFWGPLELQMKCEMQTLVCLCMKKNGYFWNEQSIIKNCYHSLISCKWHQNYQKLKSKVLKILLSKIGKPNVWLLAFLMHLEIKIYTVPHLKPIECG